MCNFPHVTDEDINKLNSDFKGYVDEIQIHELPMNWDGNHLSDFTLGDKRKMVKNKVCPYAWYQPNINWNGDVSICAVDWSFQNFAGNALEESVIDIWNGKKLQEFREMFRQTKSSQPSCLWKMYLLF